MQTTLNFLNRIYNLVSEKHGSDVANKIIELHGLTKLDPIENFEQCYIDADRFTVDPNSNITSTTHARVMAEITKPYIKLISLYKIDDFLKQNGYDNDDILYDILTGALYVHDLSSGIGLVYCVSLQTLKLLIEGQQWEKLPSKPPRWASTYTEQVKETIMCMSQSCTGAIAPSDFLICYYIVLLDEFLRRTRFSNNFNKVLKSLNKAIKSTQLRKKIENDFQRFIYPLNRPFRVAYQSPFTNITIFDKPALKTLMQNFGYFDFIKSKFNVENFDVDTILNTIVDLEYIFASLMAQKDPVTGQPITFPVTTILISVYNNKEIIDNDFFERFIALNKEGLFNIYISNLESMKVMQCCRFKMDLSEIFGKGLDSFGNGALGVGSRRVVTLNLAHIAYESKGDEKVFFKLLDKYLNEARAILYSHKLYLESIKDTIPLFKYGWLDINRTFGTFGFVAFAEAIEYIGYPLLIGDDVNESYIEFGKKILEFISNRVNDFVKEDGTFYNVEQIPAEGAATLLKKIDDIIFGFVGDDFFIYSNQFIPLWYNVDAFTKIEVEGEFYNYLSGGGITHININGRLSASQIKTLTKYAIKHNLEHFAVNPNFAICENNHTVIGKFENCPECGAKIKENITRVVGYFTPVSSWNSGRKKEYKYRYWNNFTEKRVFMCQQDRLLQKIVQ